MPSAATLDEDLTRPKKNLWAPAASMPAPMNQGALAMRALDPTNPIGPTEDFASGKGYILDSDQDGGKGGKHAQKLKKPGIDIPYPDNFAGPLQKGQSHVADLQIKGPTKLNHGLGETTVYPDDFVGPLPAGAMHMGDYKKRVEVLAEIAHGTSQVSIDTSSFMVGSDGKPMDPSTQAYKDAAKKAEAFRAQQLGNLGELAKTDVGFNLLKDLGSAKHATKIQRSSGATNETDYANPAARFRKADGTADVGTDAIVGINPTLTTFAAPGQHEDPWMTERSKYGLYHELIHAYHGVHGDTPRGAHNGINEREFQAVGLGPYAGDTYSENKIRAAMGKALRPNYGGVTY